MKVEVYEDDKRVIEQYSNSSAEALAILGIQCLEPGTPIEAGQTVYIGFQRGTCKDLELSKVPDVDVTCVPINVGKTNGKVEFYVRTNKR